MFRFSAVAALLVALLGGGCVCVGTVTGSDGGSDGSLPGDGGADASGSDAGPVTTLTYDLVVVGAGTGGVAAAIQAARLGIGVALIEPTDWVGGQMTAAAVATMDGGYADWDNGLYGELISRIQTYYAGRPMGTCYWSASTFCFEPSVAQTILREMLDEAGVDLFERTRVESVEWETLARPTVTGVLASRALPGGGQDNVRFTATVVIDATEYGDVLRLSPAPFRVGNSTSAAPDPNACVQDITYSAIIRRHPGGPPAELVLTAPPGYDATVEALFADVITATGTNGFPGAGYPYNWPTHSAYRGLPNSGDPTFYTGVDAALISKTGVNWANDYPYTAGALLDPVVRHTVECEAKLRTLQFLFYAQSVLMESEWSVAPEEGYDTPFNTEDNACANIPAELQSLERHLPPIPYVRESIRLIGMDTLVGADIYRSGSPAMAAARFHDSIAVGDYPNDLHACNCGTDGPGVLEAGLETCADTPPSPTSGPFQVPLGVLIPMDTDGLLAAEKNLSVSRLVNGAIRLQPITMATGQAAGVVAALAITDGVRARDVSPLDVQLLLIEAGCRIAVQLFSDVPRTDPSWEDIQLTATYEIMLGDGVSLFRPDDIMFRSEAAFAIAALFELPPAMPPIATFSDVPMSHPAFEAVEALVAAGLTAGCGAGLYCPADPLTRSALAVFIARGLGLDPATAPPTPYYADLSAGHYAFESVQLLAEMGLTSSCGSGNFCPDDPILRRDAAGFVARTLPIR